MDNKKLSPQEEHEKCVAETVDMITAEDLVEQAVYAANAPKCCSPAEQAENMLGMLGANFMDDAIYHSEEDHPGTEKQATPSGRTLTIKDISGNEVKLIPELVVVVVPDFMGEEHHNNGEDVNADYAIAEVLFHRAAIQGSSYAQYSLAKMHLKGQARYSSFAYAVELLTEAADKGNQWAEYQLGKMYLYGQGVDKNYDLAVHLLTSSASKGNDYAQKLLDNYHPHTHSNSSTVLASLRLLARLSQIIRDDADKRDKTGRAIDRKLMRKIQEKKLAQGQKLE